jgi:hypothetical protein
MVPDAGKENLPCSGGELEHLHSFGLPTPKFGEIYVRIGRKFGVGRSSFPAAISAEDGDLNLKNGNLTNYGIKRSNLD